MQQFTHESCTRYVASKPTLALPLLLPLALLLALLWTDEYTYKEDFKGLSAEEAMAVGEA